MSPQQARAVTEGRRILIVEDDRDLREALSEILRDEGYDVAGAAHGGEALDRLRGDFHRPALILLDLTMPVMNGWQFRARNSAGIPIFPTSRSSCSPPEIICASR